MSHDFQANDFVAEEQQNHSLGNHVIYIQKMKYIYIMRKYLKLMDTMWVFTIVPTRNTRM